ncbi:MAG TPA: gamma-glutamyltransferase [Acetobacteraceae bacterium]|nr:gamma-glutamyltransferase [Acetobacteraceae bacterium]
MYIPTRNHRVLIMGRNGAVGSNQPLATQAGLDTLRAGGNAIDASVAISLTLGVVEPGMSGLGGDGFYQVYTAENATSRCYNATGGAPIAATPERFRASGIAVRGPLSVSTPGLLGGIGAMHAALGTLPWYQLCAPAIEHAREGFAVTHHYRHFAADVRAILAADPRSRSVFLGNLDVGVPQLAALIRQTDLARTLEEIAQDGPDTFYRGRLAKRLATGMRAAGVLVDERDLEASQPQPQDPIAVAYRGFRVTQTPPNSTGFTMLQMLKIAERFDLPALDPAQRIHVLVEAKKKAFQDRERYGTDPRFGDVPLDRLLSDAYADECAAAIDMARASDLTLAEPEAAAGDTTYFCVVDAAGNAVSGIQSLNSGFGSGVTAGDTGILLNNRMAYWHLAPGHPNRLAPGKRVRHTMNAPMVFRNDKLWAVEGTPGADNQVQINLQVLTSMMDLGADPQSALEAPRWTSSQQGQGANWPHEGDGRLTIEPGFGADVLAELERLGHRLNRVAPLEGPCSVQAIRIADNGVRMAGSDPRRDGWAGAY